MLPLWVMGLLAKFAAAWSAAVGWLANPKNWPLVAIAVLLVVIWIQHSANAGKDRAIAHLNGEIVTWGGAYNSERASFRVVLKAIQGQNAAVEAMGKAGKIKTDKSAQIAASAVRALADATARAAPVLAVQTAPTACLRAEATDAAFLEAIR